MLEKREKEVQELQENAMQMLDNLELLPKDSDFNFWKPILRLWIYPSFSPHKVWIFHKANYRTINLKDIFIRQVIWDSETDVERLLNPLVGLKKGFNSQPTIESKSIKIKSEVFEEFFTNLQKIDFPAFANYNESFGIDGVSCGIETIEFTHKINVAWWSIYPDEWKDIVNWFENTTNFLEQKFNEH